MTKCMIQLMGVGTLFNMLLGYAEEILQYVLAVGLLMLPRVRMCMNTLI
jgi:hypothetical protein